ncbi:MAG: phosphate ABC transporter permease, partial [Gammaproteobacteria bacterium]|nr:phosphate ABC transporter permease [Gammaproteobacteria bacterium]
MSITADTDFLMRWRMLKDHIARHAVGIGGISVIIAIVLIFVYLLYVVIPMFEGAEIREVATYTLADQDEALYYAMEEQAEVGLQVSKQGKVLFFKTESGATIREVLLPVPTGIIVTSLAEADPASGILAAGLSNGQALVFQHAYRITYPNDQRLISPVIEFPFGETPFVVDEQGLPLLQLATQAEEEQVTFVALTPDERIILSHQAMQESLLEDEASWQTTRAEVPHPLEPVTHLLLDKQQRDLFVATQTGDVSFYDVSDWEEGPELIQQLSLVKSQTLMSSLSFLTGDISLLVGTSDGRVSQWFPVRDEGGKRVLTKIREFDDFSKPVNAIAPEHSRKGFVAVDTDGQVGIFHTTAHRTLLVEPVSEQAIKRIALGPRADAMLLQDKEQLHFYHIRNEYPEISWSSLWGKVWYESYPEPEYIWQSSSASNDFEPKLSLIPISFGTLKAAFYAMLIAVPLSIMGAIFTAHFMSPRMRQTVKPTIEIMEALPTVILGFLAGLWLAPYIENHLPGIFTLLLILPFGLFFAAWSWHMLPASIRHRVPEGWEAALLLPVVILLVFFSMELSPVLESVFFGGDIRIWMSQEFGIDYDQRNSVVVGLAMGFAVIPTIFSITEDAIFAVPKHLVQGSLALGATPWQTMMRVVILTASPGIFSAVMIGLGRAV